jgi:hypothetical protein
MYRLLQTDTNEKYPPDLLVSKSWHVLERGGATKQGKEPRVQSLQTRMENREFLRTPGTSGHVRANPPAALSNWVARTACPPR